MCSIAQHVWHVLVHYKWDNQPEKCLFQNTEDHFKKCVSLMQTPEIFSVFGPSERDKKIKNKEARQTSVVISPAWIYLNMLDFASLHHPSLSPSLTSVDKRESLCPRLQATAEEGSQRLLQPPLKWWKWVAVCRERSFERAWNKWSTVSVGELNVPFGSDRYSAGICFELKMNKLVTNKIKCICTIIFFSSVIKYCQQLLFVVLWVRRNIHPCSEAVGNFREGLVH